MQNIANTPRGNSPGRHNAPPAFDVRGTADSFARVATKAAVAFRILRWTTYGSALIILILLLHKAPPPPIERNAEAAARAEQKLADVQQAIAQGQPATLRMNETELNSYLETHMDLGGAMGGPATDGAPSTSAGSDAVTPENVKSMQSNVRDVKVQLIEDRVRAYVVFDIHGKDMTLQLEGRVRAEDGFLKFEPVSGQIGALPIPHSTLRAAVKRVTESPQNREKLKLPEAISDLRVENGEVVATYQ